MKFAGLDRATRIAAVSVGVAPASVAMLYRSVFVWRTPQKAVENDVKPPSEYDLGDDGTPGAGVPSVLAAVAGVSGLWMASFFAWAAL